MAVVVIPKVVMVAVLVVRSGAVTLGKEEKEVVVVVIASDRDCCYAGGCDAGVVMVRGAVYISLDGMSRRVLARLLLVADHCTSR